MKQPKALNNLNWGWAGKSFSLLVITVSLLWTAQAQADNTKLQRAKYDVYASGFHVVNANLEIDLSQSDKYRLYLDAVTRGFIGKVASWKGYFETKGWYDPRTKAAKPQMHKSVATWKDEEEIKEYTYNKDGTFNEYRISDKHRDRDLRETDPELSDNTTDVMTAALEVMQSIPRDGKCEGKSEIFDGKRRFKMIFENEGEVELHQSRYNIYAGPAIKCVVRVEPLGGAWHKKPRGWMSIQEQGKEKGKLPTIWMASITEGAPAVPVKILIRSTYGALVMHMTRYENAGKVILADKQPDQD